MIARAASLEVRRLLPSKCLRNELKAQREDDSKTETERGLRSFFDPVLAPAKYSCCLVILGLSDQTIYGSEFMG